MNSKLLSPVMALLLTAALAGCGGGGGGTPATGSTASPDTTPQGVPTAPKPTYTLTTTVTGSGSVGSSPAGVNCTTGGAPCVNAFDDGSTVTLTATAVPGNIFTGWAGACSGTSSCSVVLSAAKAVTATFVAIPKVTLTVATSGSGSVTGSGINCVSGAGTCQSSIDQNALVTLTAAPASGALFTNWTGATGCTTTTTCTVTADVAKTVTAVFAAAPKVTLSVITSGSGSVGGGAIACTSSTGTCQASVDKNSTVTLTATPANGYRFTTWAGATGCTTATTCTVTMDAAKSVTATFSVQVAGTCIIPRSSATSPTYATGHPKIFVNHTATLSCLQQLLASSVTSATRFQTIVNDEKAAAGNATYTWKEPKNYLFQSWQSALLYKVKGDASYGTFAVQRIDKFVSDEEALIAAGKVPYVARDSYLDIGQWVGDVALVYDWCYDLLTPTQRTRWVNYMNQAVYNVWNQANARWGGTWNGTAWTGGFASAGSAWAVNDPFNNYYYSFLRATMLLGLATNGDDARSTTWINQFRTTKLANQLLPNFNSSTLIGGGSLEGTGYGTAMKSLFQLYDWWERSTGERVATLTPHTLSSMAWMLHNITPRADYLAAVGDQARDSTVAMFDYHREYLLSLISLFPQERLSSVSKILLDGSPSENVMQNGFEVFLDYLYQPPTLPSASITDMSPTYWASGPGHLMMRSAWGDATAAFSQFTCGPYVQSHAHHEQGAFQIYRGSWLASSGNTFSSSGIHQNEEFHNLVRITAANGTTVRQVYNSPRCDLNALADNSTYAYAMADVTPVYNGNASVQKVEREYLFIKPSTFVVFDRVKSPAGTSRTWTLNVSDTPTISGDHLTMVARKATVFCVKDSRGNCTTDSKGRTVLAYTRNATGGQMDVYRLAPAGLSYQSIQPYHWNADIDPPANVFNEDGDRILYGEEPRRIDVTDTAGTQSNFLHVISTSATGASGAISNVTRSDATGQTGAQFTLADGRVVTVRFNNATSASKAANGGTLEIRNAAGAVLVTGALPTTVVVPPVFKN